MDLINSLQEFGLDKNEAAVYLALLQAGPAPVLQIAKQAGLKRPTVYLILDNLEEKGLVTLVPKEKKRLFLALPPNRIKESAEMKVALASKILPELAALYKSQIDKPSIQLFESREGILSLYRDIAKTEMKEMLSFFSPDVIPREFHESYDLFVGLYKRGVKGRDLVSLRGQRHFYFDKLSKLPNYEVRFSEPKMRFFNDTFLYNNKIAVVSFRKRFALIIENDDVVNSFRSLFELAWQSATRPNSKKRN